MIIYLDKVLTSPLIQQKDLDDMEPVLNPPVTPSRGGSIFGSSDDDIFVSPKHVPPSKPGSPGSILVLPHGHPLIHDPPAQGVSCILQTDVIYERLEDQDVLPYPLVLGDITHHEIPVMYQSTITVADMEKLQNWNDEPKDVYFEQLKFQLRDLKLENRFIVGPGITRDTFVNDIWTSIFHDMSIPMVLTLRLVSKDFIEIIEESDFWKIHFLRKFPIQVYESVKTTVENLGSWLQRYKRLSYAISTKYSPGVVIEVGHSNLKFVYWAASHRTIRLDQIEATVQMKTTRGKRSVVAYGKGEPITSCNIEDLEAICVDLGSRHEPFLNLNQRVCLLLSPGVPPPLFPERGVQSSYCETSTATLCAYNRKSGIVVALGSNLCWIEVIQDHNSLWYHVSKLGVKSNLVDEFEPLIQNLMKFHGSHVGTISGQDTKTNINFEFCCIGAPFDQEAITIFKEILKKTIFFEYSIISKVEDRIFSPVLGAFFASERNKHYTKNSNCHLLYSLFPETIRLGGTPQFIAPAPPPKKKLPMDPIMLPVGLPSNLKNIFDSGSDDDLWG